MCALFLGMSCHRDPPTAKTERAPESKRGCFDLGEGVILGLSQASSFTSLSQTRNPEHVATPPPNDEDRAQGSPIGSWADFVSFALQTYP